MTMQKASKAIAGKTEQDNYRQIYHQQLMQYIYNFFLILIELFISPF